MEIKKTLPAITIKIAIGLAVLCFCFLLLFWLIDPDFVVLSTIFYGHPPSSGQEKYPEPERSATVPANMKVFSDEGTPRWQSVSVLQSMSPVHFRNEKKPEFSMRDSEDRKNFLNYCGRMICEAPVIIAWKLDQAINPQSATERESEREKKQAIELGKLETVKYFSTGDEKQRQKLIRHLATSCKWRLTETDGKLQAVLRHVVTHYGAGDPVFTGDAHWTSELNGWLSAKDDHQEYPDSVSEYMVAVLPDGSNAPDNINDYPLANKAGAGSIVICPSFGDIEPAPAELASAKLTSAKLAQQVYDELQAVTGSKTTSRYGFDPKLVPKFSIRHGHSELRIWGGGGLGTYYVDAYVNSGEQGYAYLKAFDAVKNIPILFYRPDETEELIGWSDDPNENFFYNSLVSIRSGDPTYDYPARFELWFRPHDTSKPERKLVEAIYSICGED